MALGLRCSHVGVTGADSEMRVRRLRGGEGEGQHCPLGLEQVYFFGGLSFWSICDPPAQDVLKASLTQRCWEALEEMYFAEGQGQALLANGWFIINHSPLKKNSDSVLKIQKTITQVLWQRKRLLCCSRSSALAGGEKKVFLLAISLSCPNPLAIVSEFRNRTAPAIVQAGH